jgi:hypothetical protein
MVPAKLSGKEQELFEQLAAVSDAIAAACAARTPGYQIEAHPADWHRNGRAAGYRRNAEMIALGADWCAAFIRGRSPGSTSLGLSPRVSQV